MSQMANTDFVCPACFSVASKTYMNHVRDLFYGVGEEWKLLECLSCGLIYLSPFISENHIGDYYPENYSPYGTGNNEFAKPLQRFLKAALILPYTLRFGRPGYFPSPFGGCRMLDIGCGAGLYIRQMSELGWQCTGVDISSQAVASARRLNPSVEFHVGLSGWHEPEEMFDLISMHHVLEHLHHPKQVLADCYRRLRPGGRLVVNVPNIASFEARCFGRRWKGLDAPRHLLHFREPVLERFLKEAGFVIQSKRPEMFASSISESLGICLPLYFGRMMTQSVWGNWLRRMMVPIAATSYFLGNRGVIEFVALKV